MDTCECCGRLLRGRELPFSWEDGDNTYVCNLSILRH